MDNPIGNLDTYQKLCLIGEGSFGKVFKAVQLNLQKTVALKIISKCGRSGKELSSLKRECEIQKHLAHPNIIKFIESFETPLEFVLVTEFAHMSLSLLLEQKKRLNEINCVDILSNLISALYYLHSNRVLHRDLKPQNVLLNKHGVAMLCDFGFARSMAAGTHLLTSIKGTPLYMAPELIAEKPYDHTADLWSLGCIAYEIHMGYPPFKTMSILHLIRLLKTQEVTFPPEVSREYKDLVQGLLEKDASKRLAWPNLLNHPLLQESLSHQIENQSPATLTFDYYDKRRGSRKSITTIVESDSDDNEEWVTFLRTCLRELLTSDNHTTLASQEFILMLITSLRSQSCLVIELITHILVILSMKHQDNSAHLRQVFLETRVVSNLLLAIKHVTGDPTKLAAETDESGRQMLTRIFMFLNYLVYTDTEHNTDITSSCLQFLHQLCNTIVVFKMELHFSHLLLLHNTLAANILAILILMITSIPENTSIVTSILRYDKTLAGMRMMKSDLVQERLNVLHHLIPTLNMT